MEKTYKVRLEYYSEKYVDVVAKSEDEARAKAIVAAEDLAFENTELTYVDIEEDEEY